MEGMEMDKNAAHTDSSLRRDSNFNKLWFGETISLFGVKISELAFPFIAVSNLNASPTQVGLLGTFRFLPFLLVSLLVGVVLDRYPRRPILVFSNFARTSLLIMKNH
jgi:MFS family permease